MSRRTILALGLIAVLVSACESEPTGTAEPSLLSMDSEVLGGTPIVWAGNGHAYDAMAAPLAGGINWTDARDAAAALTLGTCPGYLVSITSQAENDFIVANLSEALPPGQRGYWIGAWQPPGSEEPAGGWTWVSGEPFEFTNWNSSRGEPNDYKGTYPETGEDAAHLWDDGAGKWNDLSSLDTTPGYVVEYDPICAAAITEILVGVKPGAGESPRPINPRSWGVVTVVAYSTSEAAGESVDFSASEVDPETVTLGDGQLPEADVARRMNGTLMARLHDVDGDGDEDLVLQFRTRDLASNGDLQPGTSVLTLAGQTYSAQAFAGSSEIRLVP